MRRAGLRGTMVKPRHQTGAQGEGIEIVAEKAGNTDMRAAQADYAGFISFAKISTIAVALIAVFVVIIIS